MNSGSGGITLSRPGATQRCLKDHMEIFRFTFAGLPTAFGSCSDHPRSHERARPSTGNTLPTLIDAASGLQRLGFLEFFTAAWSPCSESRMNSGRATAVVPSLASHQTSRQELDQNGSEKTRQGSSDCHLKESSSGAGGQSQGSEEAGRGYAL